MTGAWSSVLWSWSPSGSFSLHGFGALVKHTAEPYTSPPVDELLGESQPWFSPMVYVDFLISACLRLLPYFILRVVVSEFPQCLSIHKQL